MTALNNQITLTDGRALGFAEYGDPKGWPVMYFHGWPSSRLEAGLAAKGYTRIDDPEAVIFATQLAADYRMEFNKDVVIDLEHAAPWTGSDFRYDRVIADGSWYERVTASTVRTAMPSTTRARCTPRPR